MSNSDWIDLSAYNHRLYILQHLAGDQVGHILCLKGVRKSDIKGVQTTDEARARRLGFSPLQNTGLWVRSNHKVNTREFAVEFPLARRISMPRNEIIRKLPPRRQPGVEAGQQDQDAIQDDQELGQGDRVALGQVRDLGLNYLGKRVREGINGRFVVNDDHTTISEGSSQGMGPAVFLRAPDAAAMALCCDGFVAHQARHTVRPEELRVFTGALLGRQATEESIETALPSIMTGIRAAVIRRLAHDTDVLDRQAFDEAAELNGKIVAINIGVPFHVASAVQLMADVNGAPDGLLIASDPAGAVLSTIPRNSRVQIVTERVTDGERAASVAAMRAYDTRPFDEGVTPMAAISATAGRVEEAAWNPREDGWNTAKSVSRSDHRMAIETAFRRHQMGYSVHVLEADDDANLALETIRELSRFFQVDSVIQIDPVLSNRQPGEPSTWVFTLGARRAEVLDEPAELPIDVVADNEALWASAVETLGRRARNAEILGDLNQLPGGRRSSVRENEFQSPYISASNSDDPITAVPRFLSGAINEALRDLVKRHGNIDAWVAEELQMTQEDLFAVAAPEQIDAVGLAIDSHKRGYGFLLGDMTGVGKGRVIAMLVKWSILHDIPAIFLTERANLMSDLWRDIIDIGADKVIKPYLMNTGVIVKDMDGNPVLQGATSALNKKICATGMMAPGTNLLLATYSQFNRPGSIKSNYIRALSSGAMVIADESHNAAGDSNIYDLVDSLLDNAAFPVYSSATWAKEVRNLGFYKAIFPEQFRARGKEIGEIIQRGGQPMQEIMSAMLARTGVYTRREHDASALEFAYLTDKKFTERNRMLLNRFAPVLQSLAYLAGDVDDISARIRKQNKELLKEAREDLGRSDGKVRKVNLDSAVRSANFGSRLFNIARLFSVMTKVDAACDQALEALKNGEKPVILAESTMEAMMRDLVATSGLYPNGGMTRPNESGHIYPDFKIVLYQTLEKIVGLTDIKRDELKELKAAAREAGTVEPVQGSLALAAPSEEVVSTIVDEAVEVEDEGVEKGDLLNPDESIDLTIDTNLDLLEQESVRNAYLRIREMIAELPDLPISPFDYIRDRMEANAFTVAEISGRTLKFVNGIFEVEKRRPVNDLINDFNSGTLDVAILGKPGTTGSSLHASPRFADQNRRRMIVLQPPLDVVAFMQAIGRVNRRDQVSFPAISILSNGTPAENYIESMHNRKMRSLSANTTSNRDNVAISEDIPDILNVVGGEVCLELLETDPDFARSLAIRNIDNLDGDMASYLVMSRLCLLSSEEQERRFEDILREYNLKIEEYEARGESPLKAAEVKGRYRLENKSLFQGVEGQAGAVYLLEFVGEVELRPMRSAAVLNLVADGQEKAGAACAEALRHLEMNRWNMLRPLLPPHVDPQHAEPAELHRHSEAFMLNSAIANMIRDLQNLEAGSSITWASEYTASIVSGIITRVIPPSRREHLHMASKWVLEVAFPGNERPIRYKLNYLRTLNGMTIAPGLHSIEGRDMLQAFEYALGGTIVRRPKMLIGDELAGAMEAVLIAMNQKAGNVASITDEWGARHRGVHISDKFDLNKIPVALQDPNVICEILPRIDVSSDFIGNLKHDSDVFEIRRMDKHTFMFRVPTTQGEHGHLRQKDPIKQIIATYGGRKIKDEESREQDGIFAPLVPLTAAERGSRQRLFLIPNEDIREVVSLALSAGVKFYARGHFRDQINEILRVRDLENRVQMQDAAPEEEAVKVRVGRQAA